MPKNKRCLGFYEEDGYRGKHFTGRTSEPFWEIKEDKLFPAIPASEVEKIIKEMELRYSEQEYGWWIPRSIIDDLKSSLRKKQDVGK